MKNMMLDWPWLGSRFITISLPLLVFLYIIMWGYWVLTGTGLIDRSGVVVGGDFGHYWVAASMVRDGEAAAVYDPSRFKAAQELAFGIKSRLVWFYPPTFLLIMTPFSFLPYLLSLAVWILITLGGYLLVLRHLAPNPRTVWLCLAFPGTFQNFGYGQNGFLSVVLLGGGLLLLDSFPVAGGALLGLLTYKPHLAALIPLALITGRRWRALIAMLATAAALGLASLLVLGSEVWLAFFKNVLFSFRVLETGQVSESTTLPLFKMPTLFAAVLLAGGNLSIAAILQGALMLMVAAIVGRVWSRGGPLPPRASVLVLGILLFTPYDFIYDLAILALPLAWLGWDGYTRGWLPGEKTCLLLGWLIPLAAPLLAQATAVQITPLILGALMYLALRRASQQFSRGLTPEMMGQGVRTSQPG